MTGRNLGKVNCKHHLFHEVTFAMLMIMVMVMVIRIMVMMIMP